MLKDCQRQGMNQKTLSISLDNESQLLLIQWAKWQEKLNRMPAPKAVNAVRTWANLIEESLKVKVWNN
jgi:hypothetical protein